MTEQEVKHMAIYKVAADRVLLPYKYLADSGLPADHDTDDADLAVDERGRPKTSIATVRRGTFVYQTKADYGKLTDEQKGNSFYCDNKHAVNRLVAKNGKYAELNPKFGDESVLEKV